MTLFHSILSTIFLLIIKKNLYQSFLNASFQTFFLKYSWISNAVLNLYYKLSKIL